MSVVGITSRGNEEQAQLINLILDNSKKIVFVEGNAGTGKSIVSISSALQCLIDDKYKGMIYTRDLVQVGEEMGFLPGGIQDKVNPFLACLEDNLDAIERIGGKISKTEALRNIEIQPIPFIRGRSLHKTIMVVDEAQNLDLNTLRTVLTRIEDNCKIILMGSVNQIDKHGQKRDNCAYTKVINALKDKTYVGYVKLIKSERSAICSEIDEILQEIK